MPLVPLAVETVRTVEADVGHAHAEPVGAVAVGREQERAPTGRASGQPAGSIRASGHAGCVAHRAAAEPVRVTIGRVRSSRPPAPAPPVPTTTAPRLSLDEYLRTRGGLDR